MNEITIRIKFWGAFRKFGESVDICVPTGSTVALIKKNLQEKLDNFGLVADSVLANDHSILSEDDIFQDDITLSILPPVCGG